MVQHSSKSSFVVDVKAKEYLDSILMELKEFVLCKFIEAFSEGDMGYLDIKVGFVFRM